jgi:nicotinate-nucleotide adenylyltransferase
MTGARVGIMGGTFDPIHLGHLAGARIAADTLGLDRTLFIPSSLPPHRPDRPQASGYHRFAMIALAVAGTAGWEACDAELSRAGASYSFDTLSAFRRKDPGSQFFFITGADAFAEIATWWRYPDVLDLADFVVIARSGSSLDQLRSRLPDLAPRMVRSTPQTRAGLSDQSAIFLVNAQTPDVSSTEIRDRAARGETLVGLVPDPVASHIATHRLYR